MVRVWSFASQVLTVYSWALIVYVIMSWFGSGMSGSLRDIYRGLATICEPYLSLFRRLLPPLMVGSAGLDLSPIIALVVLQFLARFVAGL